MLNARAYSFRQKSRLAISLSWIAGYANVVVVLHSGMMISHVTGNVTHAGQLLTELKWQAAWLALALPAAFVVGAAASGASVQVAERLHRRSIYIVPMALQATLLALVAIAIAFDGRPGDGAGGTPGTFTFHAITGLGSAAMGMQNATVTRISGAAVRTTHLTGVLTDIGTEAVALALWLRDKTRRRGALRWRRVARGLRRQPDVQRVALLVSIACSFLFGVLVGALVAERMPAVGLVPPVLFLLGIILIDWREPIADVKRVDHVSDPELRSLGIEPAHLPRELGIYRVMPSPTGTGRHRAPDFTAWLADVPRGTQVCILSIAHGVSLDTDACQSLRAAAESLADDDRSIVLADITIEGFAALHANGVNEVIPPQDVCSDLEFAIVRALARSMGRASHSS